MYTVIVENHPIEMFIGLSEDEKKYKHTILVDVKLYSSLKDLPEKVKNIDQVIDYTKISSFLRSWENRSHVSLLETLRKDLLTFCFADKRVIKAEISIKRLGNSHTNISGVGAILTRQEYENLSDYLS